MVSLAGMLIQRAGGDPADLAEKLMELLNDPVRRAAMGEAGRQKAEQLFTLEKNSRRLLGVLDELVGA